MNCMHSVFACDSGIHVLILEQEHNRHPNVRTRIGFFIDQPNAKPTGREQPPVTALLEQTEPAAPGPVQRIVGPWDHDQDWSQTSILTVRTDTCTWSWGVMPRSEER